jgi:hypothetical protein
MSNTPQIDTEPLPLLAGRDATFVEAVPADYARKLRRQIVTLRADNERLRLALIKSTGSMGLMISGANPKAPGHAANLDSARKAIASTASEETKP